MLVPSDVLYCVTVLRLLQHVRVGVEAAEFVRGCLDLVDSNLDLVACLIEAERIENLHR